MLILSLSDTHRSHLDFSYFIESARPDLIVFAGDGDLYSKETSETFLKWLEKMSLFSKYGSILIGGNHDTYLEEYWEDLKEEFSLSSIHFLLNESYVLPNGVKVWGSPYSVSHGNFFSFYWS